MVEFAIPKRYFSERQDVIHQSLVSDFHEVAVRKSVACDFEIAAEKGYDRRADKLAVDEFLAPNFLPRDGRFQLGYDNALLDEAVFGGVEDHEQMPLVGSQAEAGSKMWSAVEEIQAQGAREDTSTPAQ